MQTYSGITSLGKTSQTKIVMAHQMILIQKIRIIMQWLLHHSDIPGTNMTDRLAKRGSRQSQPTTATTLHTAKQHKKSSKDIWLRKWANTHIKRKIYIYNSHFGRNDSTKYLPRKDQLYNF